MTLHLIRELWKDVDPDLPVVSLRVDRIRLAKRLWRGTADDGAEFGFELEKPFRHGDTFWQNATQRYLLQQEPEPVLEINLNLPASAAAAIGWAIGNLHLECSSEPERLLTPDEPAARQLLERIGVPYRTTSAIFRPGHFSKGPAASQELGTSHRH